ETLRWTVVQQIDSPGPTGGRRGVKTPPGSATAAAAAAFSNFKSIIVLQKSYECGDCGKSFSCSSHFGKHRRTHTG
ncbi:ZKSC2 protein, partial [Nycticryphes semicollaris]|nr:ZKSC2 protein [Nycticryphes semicollaris]